MAIEWEEHKQTGYSTFSYGLMFLEPEDLDIDEWSLWYDFCCIANGTREECEAIASAHQNRRAD